MRLAAKLLVVAALAGVAITAATAATAAGYHVEYTFAGGSDGQHPASGFVEYDGRFYGTTVSGGGDGFGTIYTFDPATGAKETVYSFNRRDGSVPAANLIKVAGTLFGTTFQGGTHAAGTVFSFDAATGAETVLYSFKSGDDGGYPIGSLISVGGILYGTTNSGGAHGLGTVFSVNPATGREKAVYSFGIGGDGVAPESSLIKVNGKLYGTARVGGLGCALQPGCGTVFSVDPTTGAETVVYAFKGGSDGSAPTGGLIKIEGQLYGTTTTGGYTCEEVSVGCGTIFSVDTRTGAEKVLYAFKGGEDGSDPDGLINLGGTLYGTTAFGVNVRGSRELGTVFSLNHTTGAEIVLHVFRGRSDGNSPVSNLIYWGRRLYGATANGGGSQQCKYVGCGTVFSIRP